MRILNLNNRNDIGANSWFLEIDGCRLILDAGIHPKLEGREALPQYDLVRNEDIDAIVISHCHHDHVGALPVAMRLFPQAHVLMSELSYFIAERVLHNSVNVMLRQRADKGILDYPLYTHEEVEEYATRFQAFRYFREVEWTGFAKRRAGFQSPVLEFYDAGHTLGSAGVWIRSDEETVFYTGDVCFHDQTLLRAARFDEAEADVLIMETTRGNHESSDDYCREAEVERLAEAIQRVLARKGSVLIPTFALGRTQEVLAILALLMRQGRLPRQPIYVGGLGRVFSEIYDHQAHRTYRYHHNLLLSRELELIVLDKVQLETMRLRGGKIFVLTAGMMNENTAAHDLALRMMGDERHAIFFVGYADPDTPGGRLKASKRGEPFFFSEAAQGEVVRYCEMEEFDLTAHANREHLLEFVGMVDPEVVILGHGEPDSVAWFAEQIHQHYPRIRVYTPGPGQMVQL